MDLSWLEYPVSGGDTMSGQSKKEINAFFKAHGSKGKILDGSGNGEGCGSLTNPASVFKRYNPKSVGRPIHGLSVKLVDDDGNPVPIGKVGKFCFSGSNVMPEYYGDKKATEAAIKTDDEGIRWFHTDTYMHMDKKGWMYMDGRERRFFITFDDLGAAYKVYCDYIQEVIRESGYATDCAVVQAKDNIRNYVPVAYVVYEETAETKQNLKDAIIEHCRERLHNYEVPVQIHEIEKIPLTKAGKVDYASLER